MEVTEQQEWQSPARVEIRGEFGRTWCCSHPGKPTCRTVFLAARVNKDAILGVTKGLFDVKDTADPCSQLLLHICSTAYCVSTDEMSVVAETTREFADQIAAIAPFGLVPITLGQHIALSAPGVSVPGAMKIANELAAGMEYLHGKWVSHKRLKPSNVMLAAGLSVRIADWWVSSVVGYNIGEEEVRYENLVRDGIAYKAPEQIERAMWIRDEQELVDVGSQQAEDDGASRQTEADEFVTPKADVYAFGVILAEMLNGRVASITTENLYVCMKEILLGERPAYDLPTVDPVLADLVRACWSLDPSHRPCFYDISRFVANRERKFPLEKVHQQHDEDQTTKFSKMALN